MLLRQRRCIKAVYTACNMMLNAYGCSFNVQSRRLQFRPRQRSPGTHQTPTVPCASRRRGREWQRLGVRCHWVVSLRVSWVPQVSVLLLIRRLTNRPIRRRRLLCPPFVPLGLVVRRALVASSPSVVCRVRRGRGAAAARMNPKSLRCSSVSLTFARSRRLG